MKSNPLHVLAPLALGLVIGGIFFLREVDSRMGAPVMRLASIAPEIGVVNPDGLFTVRVSVARGRLCQPQISRYLWRKEIDTTTGREIRHFFGINSPIIPISDPAREDSFLITMAIPRGVTPGDYFYSARLSSWCGFWGILFGDNDTISTPDVPVRVQDRPASSEIKSPSWHGGQ